MSSAIDTRTFVAVLASLATAISSGTSLVTPIANQLAADTGLTAVEKSVLTMITSAIQSAQPSSSAHNMF